VALAADAARLLRWRARSLPAETACALAAALVRWAASVSSEVAGGAASIGGDGAALGMTLPETLGHAAKLAACLAEAPSPAVAPGGALARGAGGDAAEPDLAARGGDEAIDPDLAARRTDAESCLAAGGAFEELLCALVAAAAGGDAKMEAAALHAFLPRLLPALCGLSSDRCPAQTLSWFNKMPPALLLHLITPLCGLNANKQCMLHLNANKHA